MNVYIWEHLDTITSNYHSDGGVVVIAASLELARAAFLDQFVGAPRWDKATLVGREESDIVSVEPSRVIPCGEQEAPAVFVFPDAGCC